MHMETCQLKTFASSSSETRSGRKLQTAESDQRVEMGQRSCRERNRPSEQCTGQFVHLLGLLETDQTPIFGFISGSN